MVDQQDQQAIGNFSTLSDKTNHISHLEEQVFECTELWWEDSYQEWLCVSEANPQMKSNVPQEDAEEFTSDDAKPSNEMARPQAKAWRGLAGTAANKDILRDNVKTTLQKLRFRDVKHARLWDAD